MNNRSLPHPPPSKLAKPQVQHVRSPTPTTAQAIPHQNVHVREISEQDLKKVLGWAAKEGWGPGLHEVSALYTVDPNGYYLLELDNKPIASLAAVRYSKQFAFIGLYIALPEYRGKGYGKLLWDTVIEKLSDCSTIGLNSVHDLVEPYQQSGFILAHTNTRWSGQLSDWKNYTITEKTDISLQTPSSFNALLDYNAHLFPESHTEFFSKWFTIPNAQVLTATKQDKLCGYGMISQTHEGYKIAPLFADSPATAEILCAALCHYPKKTGSVFIDIPNDNLSAVNFMAKFRAKKAFDTFRMYKSNHGNFFYNQYNHHDCFGLGSLEIGWP